MMWSYLAYSLSNLTPCYNYPELEHITVLHLLMNTYCSRLIVLCANFKPLWCDTNRFPKPVRIVSTTLTLTTLTHSSIGQQGVSHSPYTVRGHMTQNFQSQGRSILSVASEHPGQTEQRNRSTGAKQFTLYIVAHTLRCNTCWYNSAIKASLS